MIGGTLFFQSNYAENYSNIKFIDEYSLSIRILEIKDWQLKINREINDLDKIMKKEFDFYMNDNVRIYKKLKSNYNKMNNSFTMIDSITQIFLPLYNDFNESVSDSLESIPNDTTVSYKRLFKSYFKEYRKYQKKYYRSLRKLKKAFKKDKKKLVFIADFYDSYRNIYFDLKFKRENLNPNIDIFYRKLNQAVFHDVGSSDSKKIKYISVKLEQYISELDKYEKFLLNIDKVSYKEKNSHVVLLAKKESMMFMNRFEKGTKEYLKSLKAIRKMIDI